MPKEKPIPADALDTVVQKLIESGRDPLNDESPYCYPTSPIVPSMVTRQIPLKSEEANRPEALAANGVEVEAEVVED